MTINRRRAPSHEISSEKKLGGHQRERKYAALIGGEHLSGTQKGDVKDKQGKLHSVKSGRKWQVFLYRYDRISQSNHLNILLPCLEAFPKSHEKYFKDRTTCIALKEAYIKYRGRDAAIRLSNADVAKQLGANAYMESKDRLEKATASVCTELKDKDRLRDFLGEALFNNAEVSFLAIEDSTYKKDGLFKVFTKEDVLDILSDRLFPDVSTAGRVPIDYNVAGQKTLLCYKKPNGVQKNIVEIEIRNDSDVHYREVRFNMYSKDTLYLLSHLTGKSLCKQVVAYGRAMETLLI